MPLGKPHCEALRTWPFAESSDLLSHSFHTMIPTRQRASKESMMTFLNFQGAFVTKCILPFTMNCLNNGRSCRSGLYRQEVRKQVLKLLLVQIGIRQTHHLIRRLVKWPTVELALFLAELMVCMPHDWYEDYHGIAIHLDDIFNTGYLREQT